MLSIRWPLEFEFVPILSGIFIYFNIHFNADYVEYPPTSQIFICKNSSDICISPNLILSPAHADGHWPLEFVFVQILSGICILPNLVLSTKYDNRRWPL